MTRFLISLSLVLCLSMATSSAFALSITTIDDFSGGVAVENHPQVIDGGTLASSTWYDITNDTFGTPSDGGGFLSVTDGGFTNGVYAIYDGVVPAAGSFKVTADIAINSTATSGLTLYQIGAVVNGVHRGANPSDLAILVDAAAGTGVGNLATTAGVAVPSTLVETTVFTAGAGDNILIALGTNLEGPNFDANSSFWNGTTISVDNITLVEVPEPASLILFGLAGLAIVASTRVRV